MVVTQVDSASNGDPVFAMGITGSNGWSMGVDQSDSSRFKISNKWDELPNRTRLTIEEEGNVGIGTTDPSTRLHVAGDARVSGLGGSGTQMVVADNDGLLSVQSIPTDSQSLALSGTTLSITGGNSVNLSGLLDTDWVESGPDVYRGSGNVGIGTTTPAAPLEIRADGNNNPALNGLLVRNTGTNDAMVVTQVDSASNGDPVFAMGITGSNGWSMGVDQSDDSRFKISNKWDELPNRTRMTIEEEGNVGIGTTDPTSPLEIRASGNNNPELNGILVRNPGTSDAMVVTYVEDTASNGEGDPIFSMGIANENGWSMGVDQSDSSKLKFSNKWDELPNRTRLTIEEEGNVGIGTTTPSAPLEIRAFGNNNPSSNGLLVRNTDSNDAMVATQVDSASNGDPVFSMGIVNENGWSMGVDKSDDSRFKISNKWDELTNRTRMTIEEDGDVGIGTTTPSARLDVNGTVNTSDSLTIDGSLPIMFERFDSLGNNVNHNTNISTSEYNAAIVGFNAEGGKINEVSTAGELISVYMEPNQDGFWYIIADFRTLNSHEDWFVDVMFIKKGLSSRNY